MDAYERQQERDSRVYYVASSEDGPWIGPSGSPHLLAADTMSDAKVRDFVGNVPEPGETIKTAMRWRMTNFEPWKDKTIWMRCERENGE